MVGKKLLASVLVSALAYTAAGASPEKRLLVRTYNEALKAYKEKPLVPQMIAGTVHEIETQPDVFVYSATTPYGLRMFACDGGKAISQRIKPGDTFTAVTALMSQFTPDSRPAIPVYRGCLDDLVSINGKVPDAFDDREVPYIAQAAESYAKHKVLPTAVSGKTLLVVSHPDEFFGSVQVVYANTDSGMRIFACPKGMTGKIKEGDTFTIKIAPLDFFQTKEGKVFEVYNGCESQFLDINRKKVGDVKEF